jgi:hypothetical protein
VTKVDQLRALREARFTAHTGTKTTVRPESQPRRKITQPQGEPPVTEAPSALEVPLTLAESEPASQHRSASPAVALPPVPSNSTKRLIVVPGKPIGSYRDSELSQVVSEILDATPNLPLEDVINEVMNRLGFVRKGKNIRSRIGQAYENAASRM